MGTMWGLSLKQKQCVHYWIIDSPDGPTSKGRCKYCGIVADFFNNLQGCLNKTESPAAGNNSEESRVFNADDLMLHIS